MSHDAAVSQVTARSPYLRSPRPKALMVYERLALGSASALTAVLVAVAVIVTVRREELKAAVGSDALDSDVMSMINRLTGLAVIATIAALLTTTWWLQSVRDIARWHNPGHPERRSAFWVPMGWFVPIVELWFPYQVVADASRAVGSKVTNFWPWWISWLLVMHGTVLFDRMEANELLESASGVSAYVWGYQAGAVVIVISFLLWCRVVRSATTAAAAAATGVRVAS